MEKREVEIFSAEERDDINARIEAASAREAVAAPGLPSKEQASRRGLFPILVNAGAAALLAAGICLLFSFQQSDTAKIRESAAVPGVTERALIREIRNEANLLLNEKDAAINAMNERIANVDSELRRLASLESLTDEQRAAMAELIRKQEEYRESLAQMRVERARILTNARIREAEARHREETLLEQNEILNDESGPAGRTEIENAVKELAKLSDDAEKAALILALLSEAQKDGTGSVVPITIEETPPVPPGTSAEEALRKQVASQAASIAEQNAALAVMEKTLEEFKTNFSDLQQQNNTFKLNIEEKDKQLENLKAQNASYAQTIDTLQRTISNVNAALENRQNQQ